MAKITRVLQKIFGSSAIANQRSEFGSLAEGAPSFTTDPVLMQSRGVFESGWFEAVLGFNSPAMEDRNTLDYLITRQIAYLLQQGVSEWNDSTSYYINSMAMDSNGIIYQSVSNDNLNNLTTDAAHWKVFVPGVTFRNLSASATVLFSDSFLIVDCTAGDVTLTLPPAADFRGRSLKIKKIDTSSNKVIIDPDSAELVEKLANIKIGTYLESIEIFPTTTEWLK